MAAHEFVKHYTRTSLADIAQPFAYHLHAGFALAVAIVLLVIVRGIVAAHVGLTDDEAYYRLWALAPAWSYLDHPPMVAWWIAAGRWLVGDTPLGLRLMQLVAFVVGTAAFWRAGTILFDARVGRLAAWVTLAMPLLGAGGVVITPFV